MADERVRVEVAYAVPDRQVIIALEAHSGVTVEEAIRKSGILDQFPEIDAEKPKVGVFGKATTMNAVLVDGDRVEIYRPLIADPKEARRKRAAEGKALKNRSAGGRDDQTPEESGDD